MSSDLMIVWSYLTLCIILGFFKIPKINNLNDYAIGSKQFPTIILAFSMIATVIDSGETIGQSEKAFSLGMVFCVTAVFQLIRWPLMGSLLAPAIGYLKANKCTTLVDIMKFYYGKWGKYICLITLSLCVGLLSIYYKSAAFILERYLNIPFINGVLIITASVAIYSILGGMHAVILTDVVQFFIFIIIIPAIFIIGLMNIDLESVVSTIPHEKLYISSENWLLLLSFFIYDMIPTTGFPYIQRGLMTKNAQQLKNVFMTTGIMTFFFFAMMGSIGLLVSGIDNDIKSDDALFYFIDNAVPASVSAFFAVSILAVIMSTASSFLNSVTVIIVKDIIVPLFPQVNSDAKQLFLTKFAGLIVVIASFGMVFVKDHIMDMFWMLDNFWDPFVSIPLLFGLAGIRIQTKNFKYVLIITFIALICARIIHGDFDTITLSAGVITSSIVILFYRDKSMSKTERGIDEEDEIKIPSIITK